MVSLVKIEKNMQQFRGFPLKCCHVVPVCIYIYILEDLGCKMESLILRHTLFFWCLLLHPFRQIKIPQLTAIKHLSHHIHITYHIIIYHIYIYIYLKKTAHHNVFSMFSLTKNLSTQRNRYQTSLSPANGAAKYG